MQQFLKSKKALWAILFSLVLVFGLSACAKKETPQAERSQERSQESAQAQRQEASDQAQESEEAALPTTDQVRLAGLKGPTSMGLAQLATDNPAYRLEISGAPDAIVPKVLKGETDIAAVPANLSAVLYAKSEGKIQVLAINTLGVLHLVDRDGSIQSVADLKGRKLVASGQGASPEYALNYLLKENGLSPEEVEIEWKQEHTEVVAALAEDSSLVGLLPEPFVSVAEGKLSDLHRAVDLTKAFDQIQEKEGGKVSLVSGVFVASKDFIEKHPDQVEQFLKDAKASVDFANTKPEEAAAKIDQLDIVKADIAKKAIPGSNLVSISGTEMQSMLSSYLTLLFDADPKSVGGKVPAEDFYYLPEK